MTRPLYGLAGHGAEHPRLFVSAQTVKMCLAGRALLPRNGIGAMPELLGRRPPATTVAFGARVKQVIVDAGRAMGVAVDGRVQPAAAVVVATDPPAARALTGIDALPEHRDGIDSLTVFLAGRRRPGIGPRLVLDDTGRLTLNHLAPLSTVQPAYALPGSHLLAAVIVGTRLPASTRACLAIRRRSVASTSPARRRSIPVTTVRSPAGKPPRDSCSRRRQRDDRELIGPSYQDAR